MKTVKITIEGTTPLLMNRFTDEAQLKAEHGSSVSMGGQVKTPRDQAEPKVYRNATEQPVIPGPNIFSCIVAAGKFHKAGKSKITTAKSSLIPAGISVLDIDCPVSPSTWEVDSRPIVNPATGGRRPAHRPRFDAWAISFSIEVDDTMFDVGLVRSIVDDAGKRIGLGDFRPDRKGPFGKFKVTSWAVE